MLEARFRAMPIWPYPATPSDCRKSRYHFKAAWSNTLDLLERELRHLSADEITLGIGLQPRDIRNDGWPRSDVRVPNHPGVELSFTGWVANRRQRLVYATDEYPTWQHNVRAIALGLEALRAVDRHGITSKGQQYAGFAALPPGGPSPERGAALVKRHGGVKHALHATHPDHGGNALEFADVRAAQEAGVV